MRALGWLALYFLGTSDINIYKSIPYSYLRDIGAHCLSTLIDLTLDSKENFASTLECILCLRDKLMHAARYFAFVKQVSEKLARYPELKEQLPFLKDLDLTIENSGSFIDHLLKECSDPSSFDQFINKLFMQADDPLMQSHFGRIIATYYLIDAHIGKIYSTFMALGELDSYLALVRLFRAHKDDPEHPYCFAEIQEADQCCLYLKDFWNPMVENAVPNTLKLGKGGKPGAFFDKPQDLILTGPNTGGKSTFMRAVAIIVLIVQVWGIGPAKQIVITPFSNVKVYSNITDDPANGRSFFKVSAERAKEVVVNAKKGKGHSLSLFDEIYNGTDPKAGTSLTYSTLLALNDIARFPRSICLAITHFPCVEDLCEDIATNFALYRVYDKNDTEHRYQVRPGIYTDFNTFEIAQEEAKLDEHIVETGRHYYQRKFADAWLASYLSTLEAMEKQNSLFPSFFERISSSQSSEAYQSEEAKNEAESLKAYALNFFRFIMLSPRYYSRLLTVANACNYPVEKIINHKDRFNRTLLHIAAMRNTARKEDSSSIELIKFILKHADSTVSDIRGKQPIDYAYDNTIMKELLDKHSKENA